MKQSDIFISIKNKKEIAEIFRRGQRCSFGTAEKKNGQSKSMLSAKYIGFSQNVLLPIQVVFAVSKKQGNAVKRNRLKRILRAALFEAGRTINITNEKKQSFRLAVFCNNSFEKIPFDERVALFHKLLLRLQAGKT